MRAIDTSLDKTLYKSLNNLYRENKNEKPHSRESLLSIFNEF
jgi:hypothetical protein